MKSGLISEAAHQIKVAGRALLMEAACWLGGQSSHRHAHSRQDEFVFVLEAEVTLETNAGEQILAAGMCAGFPAGTEDAHRFVNHSSADTVLLVVGDRTANDEVSYPDIDMHLQSLADGTRRFTHKDGTPY